MVDYNGLAILIPSAVAGIVTIATLGMTIVNWSDARQIKRKQAEMELASKLRDTKILEVKNLVNGQSDRLLVKATKEAYEQGRQHERENGPAVPSPAYPKARVDELLKQKQAEIQNAAPASA